MNEIVSSEGRPEAVKAFFERIETAAESIQKLEKAVVVTHHDCDGLTSGGIITKALQRLETPVHTITLKQLYSEDVERLKNLHASIIFTDFGSSYIELLKKELSLPFFVIDHHQKGNGSHEGHINPMEFGLDGGVEISSAGIAYNVARAISPQNRDLASIGVVGAVGDMQDSRSNGLQGLNALMVKEGVGAGVLDVKTDLRLYGRISRPLAQYLSFSTNPILPDLTANKDHCVQFLQGMGIPLQDGNGNWRSYEDLSHAERRTLTTGLVMHLNEYNTPQWKLDEMIGEVYTLTKEDPKSPLRDAKEFSTVLNACVIPGTEVYLNGKPTEIQHIQSENVFSVENGKIIRDKIVAKHEIPLPDGMKVFQITTQTGRNVSVTQNHEIMSLSNGNVRWIASENLKEGDFIAISKAIPDVSKSLNFWDFFKKEEFQINGGEINSPNSRKAIKIPSFDFDLGLLIGYIAGDGHVKKNNSGVDIAFSKKPRDLHSFERIKKILEMKFGIKKYYVNDHPNCFNAVWHSSTFSFFIQRMGIPKGEKSSTVSFAPQLLEAEKPIIAGLLSGLFSSDGNIYSGGIEFSTHSTKMVEQMNYLLQRFGLVAHVTHRKCMDCSGRKYRLLICGKNNIQKFVQEIGFPYSGTNEQLLNLTSEMNPINSRELYLPVREKLLTLFEWFGVPTEWASHFTYYKKGKQPGIENVRKYVDYFENKIAECEQAVVLKDLRCMPTSLRFSREKIAKSCGISAAWLLKMERGKVPGKNAQKKMEKGFLFYTGIINKAKQIVKEIQQFMDSDIYWDKIKKITEIEEKPKFVYDITVEKNHNYIANGIVVHNCGRNGQSTIGFHVCLGDRIDYYARAMGLLQEHRRNLAEGIQLMQQEGLEEKDHFYFFDAHSRIKDSIVGIVAGMLYGSGSVKTDKPIVAFSRHEDGSIKVSARATSELVRNGVNLGLALKETCRSLGGTAEGGGHCLHPTTLVMQKNGVIKKIEKIKAGDQLLSRRNHFIRDASCTNVFANPKNEIVLLKTPVFSILASKNHRFFVFRDFKIVEEKVENINEGDFALCVKKTDFEGKKIEIENNPFIYLKVEGIRLLKNRREEMGMTRLQVVRQGTLLQKHTIYDVETFQSHRMKKDKLLEFLDILDIEPQNFLETYTAKSLQCNSKFLNEDMGWLIGYIQGDGNIGKKRTECKEPDLSIINRFERCIRETFSLNTHLTDKITYQKMRVYSADLCRFFEDNFPESKLLSGKLELPEKIMQAEKPVLAAYIGGLFDADGGAYDRFVHLDMIDNHLLKGVQLLLLRFGIVSNVREYNGKTRLDITDFESLKKFHTEIGFTPSSKKEKKLATIISKQGKKKRNSNIVSPITYGSMRGFLARTTIPLTLFDHNTIYKRDRKKHITYPVLMQKFMGPLLNHFDKFNETQKEEIQQLNGLINSNYFTFYRITKKRVMPNECQLFDLSVPATENFLANGFVVHNSIAAGCRIEPEQGESFLEMFDRKLGEQAGH